MSKILLIGISLASAWAALLPSGESQLSDQPQLNFARVPFYRLENNAYGEIRLMMNLDERSRLGVQVVSAPQDVLGRVAAKDVGDWSFTGRPARFEMTVRYIKRGGPCESDRNQLIEIHPPTSVDVYAPATGFCEPIAVPAGATIHRSRLSGRIVCDCADHTPIVGARVNVRREPPQSRTSPRTVRTDSNGDFGLHGLIDGSYLVEVSAPGSYVHLFSFAISASETGSTPVTLRLKPEDRQTAPPDAVVTAADVALYPRSALNAGTDGDVTVRLSLYGSEVIDVDTDAASTTLAAAAAANARSWRFENVTVPVLRIVYHYELLPGSCVGDQRPAITMRFPREVTVAAHRPIPCGK